MSGRVRAFRVCLLPAPHCWGLLALAVTRRFTGVHLSTAYIRVGLILALLSAWRANATGAIGFAAATTITGLSTRGLGWLLTRKRRARIAERRAHALHTARTRSRIGAVPFVGRYSAGDHADPTCSSPTPQ